MLNTIINNYYCYDFLVNQIPISVLLYSHIPSAVVSLIFGYFILKKAKDNISAKFLFALSISFTAWCVVDLITWFAFLGQNSTMFFWSFLEVLDVLFFVFSFYFIYSFNTGKYPKFIYNALIGSILLPAIFFLSSRTDISYFDATTCEAIEDSIFLNYIYGVEILMILITLFFTVKTIVKSDEESRSKIYISGAGILLFLASFSFTSYIATNFNDYTILTYSTLGMPVFLGLLTYLVVKFKVFNIKLLGAQALVVSIAFLTGSQIISASNRSDLVISGFTFLLSLFFGYFLIKSVKKEVQAREEIEELAIRLRSVNKVLSHDVKGALGKHAILFRALADGDFGPVPEQARIFIEQSAKDATKLVDAIMIMLQSGHELTFHPTKFNIGTLVKDIVDSSKAEADKKGLSLTLRVDDVGSLDVELDQSYIKMHVIQNLISNSINYTLSGGIDVYIGKSSENKILFTVKDTGVGISREDAPKMFSEGGHGEHSAEVNVHSTGYGLFSAKRVVDACGGKIWFDSEGIPGKGTTFCVELPLLVETTESKVGEEPKK